MWLDSELRVIRIRILVEYRSDRDLEIVIWREWRNIENTIDFWSLVLLERSERHMVQGRPRINNYSSNASCESFVQYIVHIIYILRYSGIEGYNTTTF